MTTVRIVLAGAAMLALSAAFAAGILLGPAVVRQSPSSCVDGVFINVETGFVMGEVLLCGRDIEVHLKDSALMPGPQQGEWQ